MTDHWIDEAWHSYTRDEVLEKLGVSQSEGLTDEQVRKRLQAYGANELPKVKKESQFLKFIKQFHDVLIYVLLAAAVITLLLGHFIDTAVIVAVAIVNAVIGYFQENKAEKALEGIQKMLSLYARVRRDGTRNEIDSTQLVIGDIVLLSAGDKVPAYVRLINTEKKFG